MTAGDSLWLLLFFLMLLGFAVLLGEYMAKVFRGQRMFLTRLLRPLEQQIYKWGGVDETAEMSWQTYAAAFLIFNGVGLVFLFLLELAQGALPLNPQGLGGVRWDTAVNAAVSFVTNTNWQSYSGETTMSYLTQMVGLAVQNFVSAAAGIAAAVALMRGFIRRTETTIGNFWVDLTRSVVYVLLPLSLVWGFLFLTQGVVQTFGPSVHAQTLEGQRQVIAVGPAASQIAIKELGSNGGGFFNVNSAHPFENPTPLTNFLSILAILLIPAALPFTFGAMLKDRRQGAAIFAAMMILFAIGLALTVGSEVHGNPYLAKLGVKSGINMEGKEVRFGVVPSILWAQSTTATANGSVNAMHDSFMPLSSVILILNMGVGEVIFGGVGVGLIGMIFYAILTMFLAGLMIGRTPEFLGKKLESFEMIMALVALLVPAAMVLLGAGAAIISPVGLSSRNNAGPHGLSEILYAFASAGGNNGSAFAGLNANTVFYNLILALTMLVGRIATVLPALAVAGSLVRKKAIPPSSATLATSSAIFVLMLIGVVIIFGALTFFPVLTLGPIVEHLLMNQGQVF
jgi:K+-transporting ATPase ATPase A chain